MRQKWVGDKSDNVKLYVMAREEDVRRFEQPLQIHLLSDPAEGADDDCAAWNRLVQGAGWLLHTRIAGRKDYAFKRLMDFIERSAVLRC